MVALVAGIAPLYAVRPTVPSAAQLALHLVPQRVGWVAMNLGSANLGLRLYLVASSFHQRSCPRINQGRSPLHPHLHL